MRSKRVWRYYCDFCKKSGCHSGHMREHEKHCVRNPERKCRRCAKTGSLQATREELLTAAAVGLDELRRASEGCPVCMLVGATALHDRDPDAAVEGFSFDSESAEAWRIYNEERQAEEYARCGGAY